MGKSYIHDVNLTYMQGINYQKKEKNRGKQKGGRKKGRRNKTHKIKNRQKQSMPVDTLGEEKGEEK